MGKLLRPMLSHLGTLTLTGPAFKVIENARHWRFQSRSCLRYCYVFRWGVTDVLMTKNDVQPFSRWILAQLCPKMSLRLGESGFRLAVFQKAYYADSGCNSHSLWHSSHKQRVIVTCFISRNHVKATQLTRKGYVLFPASQRWTIQAYWLICMAWNIRRRGVGRKHKLFNLTTLCFSRFKCLSSMLRLILINCV